MALKFLHPETAGSPEAAARLLREARAASALDHPHIATIYEIGDHAGRPFIAMSHYEGQTLATRLGGPTMTIAEVARIVAQVADALQAAHAAGIVHRDLKPSHLMLTTTGQVKVLDFGIRLTPTGWLWNVSGLDGVEVQFDDGHRFRVGSDEPNRLAEALLREMRAVERAARG